MITEFNVFFLKNLWTVGSPYHYVHQLSCHTHQHIHVHKSGNERSSSFLFFIPNGLCITLTSRLIPRAPSKQTSTDHSFTACSRAVFTVLLGDDSRRCLVIWSCWKSHSWGKSLQPKCFIMQSFSNTFFLVPFEHTKWTEVRACWTLNFKAIGIKRKLILSKSFYSSGMAYQLDVCTWIQKCPRIQTCSLRPT